MAYNQAKSGGIIAFSGVPDQKREMHYDIFRCLTVDITDGLAIVRLNRPKRLNAISRTFFGELESLWPLLSRDPSVDAIVLTGSGKAFCVGGDISEMDASEGGAPLFDMNSPAQTKRVLRGMLTVEQPLICAINGDAVGLGATMALACDISVIAAAARIGDPHTRMGLVPGDGSIAFWPALVGRSRAKDLLMRGRLINGDEAHALGAATHLAADGDAALTKAISIARELLALSTVAIRWTKSLMNREMLAAFDAIIDSSQAMEMLSTQTPGHAKAVQDFVARKKA
ncbi:enoyl-CoA hydratase/isomerase family protein [Sphingobium baderi]|nr:enoyl-CoA hydratase/isomerase family protein [Sphingobium baderi]